jgi:hypothetical protein
MMMAELIEYVPRTNTIYSANYKSEVRTFPIPFFDDIERAEVLTIGLNPSATEFESRGWREVLNAGALTQRLLRYFDRGEHPWFSEWRRRSEKSAHRTAEMRRTECGLVPAFNPKRRHS